ncbi:MAG: efflux RND transporter permease subunit, partial [Thiohalocapsa sp.]
GRSITVRMGLASDIRCRHHTIEHSILRHVLLTSITTVAGLTPLLLEKSLQAQILIPLAASLAFGLVTAAVAALFLVPAVYVIIDDFDVRGALEGEMDEPAAWVPATSGPVG